MRKQALVVGLGQFGMALARSLTERGVDVLAVDIRPELVHIASSFATESACFNGMDEIALSRAAPQRRDICVCAIGNESREGAIIITALLRKMGATRVVARATDEVLERILYLVGAHEVFNVESAFGERLATKLLFESILEEIPLGDDLVITEFSPTPSMIGRTLLELKLRQRFGISVIAIRRIVNEHGTIIQPEPEHPLQNNDIMIVVAPPGATRKLSSRFS